MGRHSSADQRHFYRSFAGWVMLWAVIAVVAGVAVWFIVGALGATDVQRPIAAGRGKAERPVPAPTVSGVRIAATPETPQPAPTPMETEAPPEDVELITKGISVQVLNGTSDPSAARTMADELSGLGFTIIAVEDSSQPYAQTTVFWSTDASQDAAVALAESNGWVAEPKPANLADTVSIHVVVGADEV
jgi:hypothetical protein